MQTSTWSSLAGVLLALSLVLHTGLVVAEDEPSVDSARAVELGHQGLRLFQQGSYDAALEHFEQAERLAHSPVFVLYMARINRELGRLLVAKALFEKVVVDAPRPDAPDVWQDALRDAELELGALNDRIPSIQIVVRGASSFPMTLVIDERSAAIADRQTLVELDPGRHVLTVKGSNGLQRRRTVNITEGERGTVVVFDLQPDVAARSPVGPDTIKPAEDIANRDHAAVVPSNGMRPGGFTALGLGVGALTFGGIAGFAALKGAEEIKDNCVADRCLIRDRERGASVRRWANLATVGFAVGVVGIGTGLTLLLWPPSTTRPAATLRLEPAGGSIAGYF